MPPTNWVHIALGGVLILFGRRLFWLLVAILGFLLGAEIGAELFAEESQKVVILVAIGAGIVGALLAVFLQRLAFGLAGLLAGAYLALLLAGEMGWNQYAPFIALAGGLIGSLVAVKATDWIVIVASSLAGAAAVAVALDLRPMPTGAVFAALAVFGIFLQGQQHRDRKGTRKRLR